MTDYKGWQIEIQTKPAPDAAGWRVYAMLSTAAAGAVRTVPLSFKDGRVFATEVAAKDAGMQLATAWIDRQG